MHDIIQTEARPFTHFALLSVFSIESRLLPVFTRILLQVLLVLMFSCAARSSLIVFQ